MKAMCEAGFDVIDLYPMTDSYPDGTLANDVVHYPNKVFDTVEHCWRGISKAPSSYLMESFGTKKCSIRKVF